MYIIYLPLRLKIILMFLSRNPIRKKNRTSSVYVYCCSDRLVVVCAWSTCNNKKRCHACRCCFVIVLISLYSFHTIGNREQFPQLFCSTLFSLPSPSCYRPTMLKVNIVAETLFPVDVLSCFPPWANQEAFFEKH